MNNYESIRQTYLDGFKKDSNGKAIVIGHHSELIKLESNIPVVCNSLLHMRKEFKRAQRKCKCIGKARRKAYAKQMSLICRQAGNIAKTNGFFLRFW